MIQTVMTLSAADCAFLRGAVAVLLAAQASAQSRFAPFSGRNERNENDRRACLDLCEIAIFAAGERLELSHEEGNALLTLLGEAGDIELRIPAEPAGILHYYSDEQIAGQVGPDEEAWQVPVMLTVVGAETALEAGSAAGHFLGRATAHDAVNFDETIQAYDIGYEAADTAHFLRG